MTRETAENVSKLLNLMGTVKGYLREISRERKDVRLLAAGRAMASATEIVKEMFHVEEAPCPEVELHNFEKSLG